VERRAENVDGCGRDRDRGIALFILIGLFIAGCQEYLSTRPRPVPFPSPVYKNDFFDRLTFPQRWTGPANTTSLYDSNLSKPGCAVLVVCLFFSYVHIYIFFSFERHFHWGPSLTVKRKTPADRRPIDPPPIVQLRVIDKARKNLPSPSPSPPPQHHPQPPSHPHGHTTHEPSGPLDASMLTPAGFGAGPFLQNPYYFMFASLAKPDDDTELHWMKVRSCANNCAPGTPLSPYSRRS